MKCKTKLFLKFRCLIWHHMTSKGMSKKVLSDNGNCLYVSDYGTNENYVTGFVEFGNTRMDI